MTKTTNRAPAEMILGYQLKERIGSGGYGEVWTAEAPGGLQKAIKFIFGVHDGDRAVREMKSLSHIKAVRHPFLLSLERIDIVDGQLIIITELAEMSLKDRFDACIAQGMRGIPRDELLLYMQEAAEGLDYINHQHSLQHLDIKPENILLASGHVKVADFGLVKQIHDATASLMGGLTPLYAPPELFDGRPTRNSDQYSLAIVYQEMLTGTRPFDGETAAQLAAQHLRGRPRLSRLPRSDRSVVATALSKDPGSRHADCRTLVRRLHANQFSEIVGDAITPKQGGSDTEQIAADMRSHGQTTGMLRISPLRRQAVQVTTLPPISHETASSTFRPTLVIGLGRTGTTVVQRVRERLSAQAGGRDELPGYALLAIDTDVSQLRQTQHGQNSCSVLTPREILETPLRSCEEYRERSKSHLTWLSRRWLYNIPRSLLTEGIRPLGRLAFADHVAEIRERLVQIVRQVTDRNSVRRTAERLGLRPSDMGPRIIIASSISGGFGSGCVLDVAYLVRHVLTGLGVPDDALIGILAYSAQLGTPQDRELMLANTYACLSEYYHYARVGFAADEACQLPELEPDQAAFGQLYLVDNNRASTQRDDFAAIDAIAEYVYQASATTCATLLDRCRLRPRDVESPEAKVTDSNLLALGTTVSSFGLSSVGGRAVQVWKFANRMVDSLLARWILGAPDHRGEYDIETLWKDLSAEIKLDETQLFQDVQETVGKLLQLPADQDGWMAAQVQSACSEMHVARTGPQLEVVCDRLDEAVRCIDPASDTGRQTAIHARHRECMRWVSAFASRVGQALQPALLGVLDQPTARIYGATQLVGFAQRDLDRFASGLRQRHEEIRAKVQDARAELLRPRTESPKGAEANVPILLQTYLRTRYLETLFQVARAAVSAALQHVAKLNTALKDVTQQLNRVQERRQDVYATDSEDNHRPCEHLLVDELMQHQADLIGLLEKAWLELPGDEALPLSELLLQTSDREALRLESRLLLMAQNLLREVFRTLDVSGKLARLVETDADATAELHRRLKQVQPSLIVHGGAKRLIVVASQVASEAKMTEIAKQHLDEVASVVTNPGGDAVFLYELSQVPLANVSTGLLANHPDALAFAARLKTRIDVEWSPLTELL